MTAPSQRGILVIISSPSGAGKTTLSHRLLDEFAPRLEFSVSYTTRHPRPGEVDGRDYRFVDDATFERMIAAGELAEWAYVHGNRYGTSRAAVERALDGGHDVVFDVDGQGGHALHALFPRDALMVFILPPDLDTLAERLRRRATDDPEVIERRLKKAIEEIAYHREYQFRIVNRDLDEAYQELRAIYLLRRWGEAPGPDAPDDLPAAAARVDANRGADHFEYAERLVTAHTSG